MKRDIALIDSLWGQSAEHSCLEFKQDNADPKLIGKYAKPWSCWEITEVLHG